MNNNMTDIIPLLIEFLGTYLYVLVNFITRDPIVVSFMIGSLFIISAYIFGHKGDFNPGLTFPEYLLSKYSKKSALLKIITQLLGGMIAVLTYKIYTYYKDDK